MLLIGGFLLWLFISAITGTLCWFQAVVGLPCPSCGSTRATMELFRGNLWEAHIWHPLVIISLLLFIYLALRFIFKKNKPLSKTEKILLISAVGLYLVTFVIRLVFLFPHTEPLIPHENAIWRQVLKTVIQIFC